MLMLCDEGPLVKSTAQDGQHGQHAFLTCALRLHVVVKLPVGHHPRPPSLHLIAGIIMVGSQTPQQASHRSGCLDTERYLEFLFRLGHIAAKKTIVLAGFALSARQTRRATNFVRIGKTATASATRITSTHSTTQLNYYSVITEAALANNTL